MRSPWTGDRGGCWRSCAAFAVEISQLTRSLSFCLLVLCFAICCSRTLCTLISILCNHFLLASRQQTQTILLFWLCPTYHSLWHISLLSGIFWRGCTLSLPRWVNTLPSSSFWAQDPHFKRCTPKLQFFLPDLQPQLPCRWGRDHWFQLGLRTWRWVVCLPCKYRRQRTCRNQWWRRSSGWDRYRASSLGNQFWTRWLRWFRKYRWFSIS